MLPHPQLPPEPQEDFVTGAGSATGVEQLPVLHPPEVDVFVLQQPMMCFLIYEEAPRKGHLLCLVSGTSGTAATAAEGPFKVPAVSEVPVLQTPDYTAALRSASISTFHAVSFFIRPPTYNTKFAARLTTPS